MFLETRSDSTAWIEIELIDRNISRVAFDSASPSARGPSCTRRGHRVIYRGASVVDIRFITQREIHATSLLRFAEVLCRRFSFLTFFRLFSLILARFSRERLISEATKHICLMRTQVRRSCLYQNKHQCAGTRRKETNKLIPRRVGS